LRRHDQREGRALVAQHANGEVQRRGVGRDQLLDEGGAAWRPDKAQIGEEAGRKCFGAIGEAPAKRGHRRRREDRLGLTERRRLRGAARSLAARWRRVTNQSVAVPAKSHDREDADGREFRAQQVQRQRPAGGQHRQDGPPRAAMPKRAVERTDRPLKIRDRAGRIRQRGPSCHPLL